jgi:hypothetical protein
MFFLEGKCDVERVLDLDKKELKNIEVTEVIKHRLSSGQDMTGEWETNCNIDFKLSIPIWITVFDKEYKIDRIKMSTRWDEIVLEYANEKQCFCCFPVSKTLVHKVTNRVIQEQRTGIMKGWSFSEDLIEILRSENALSNCYY